MKAENIIPAGRKACFTLLELLIVIGIILIILGFTVPSFRKMASGNAVNASARMISGQLRLARAAAIAEQRYIALIMPGETFDEPSESDGKTSNEADDYHFRSFRVGVVRPTGGTLNQFELVEWYPGTSWTFLPPGAVIAKIYEECKADSKSKDYELYTDSSVLTVNSDWPEDGELKDKAAPYVIDGDAEEAKLAYGSETEKKNDSAKACARCVVFSPKGRCCTASDTSGTDAKKQYITIVEGNVDIADDKFTLAESNVKNMRVIKVSDITGRSSYVAIGE